MSELLCMKYAPKLLSDCITFGSDKETIYKFLDGGSKLFISSKFAVGKTTLARCLIGRYPDAEIFNFGYMNYNQCKSKIKKCSSVLIDELESLPESYHSNLIKILKNKTAVITSCRDIPHIFKETYDVVEFDYSIEENEQHLIESLTARVSRILSAEDIQHDIKRVRKIVKRFSPDIRTVFREIEFIYLI